MLLVRPRNIRTDLITHAFHYLTDYSVKDLKSFLSNFGLNFDEEFYFTGDSYYTNDTHEKLTDRTYVVLAPDKTSFTLIPYYKFWANYATIDI
jgi:hypothetical protein